jgi:ribosome-associated translation inhibitor RaiA
MNVAVMISSRQLRDAVRGYVDQRVQLDLARFADRVQRVSVGISDVDEATGDRSYSCRVRAEVTPSGDPLVEEALHHDLFRAIDGAVYQLGRALWERVRESHSSGSSTRPLDRHLAAASHGG